MYSNTHDTMELKNEKGQSASKRLSSEKEYDESSSTILCCGEVLINTNPINKEMVDTQKNTIYIYCLSCPETIDLKSPNIGTQFKQINT